MDALLFRTRVAVSWVAVALALSGSMWLALYMPGALEEVLAGEVEGRPSTTPWASSWQRWSLCP